MPMCAPTLVGLTTRHRMLFTTVLGRSVHLEKHRGTEKLASIRNWRPRSLASLLSSHLEPAEECWSHSEAIASDRYIELLGPQWLLMSSEVSSVVYRDGP